MTHILCHLDVFPEIFKYLAVFGLKDFAQDEGFSGFDITVIRNEAGALDRIGILCVRSEVVSREKYVYQYCRCLLTSRVTTELQEGVEKLMSLESCYLLKYAETHNEPGNTINPWAIRQVCVYQSYHVASHQSSQILVRLSRNTQEQLRNSFQDQSLDSVCPWQNIHLLCLGSVNSSWRHYINYLDEKISKLVRHL